MTVGPMSAGMSLLVIWLLAAIAQSAGWWWQKRHRNAGLVDVIWSASVGAGAVVAAILGDGALLPRILLGVLGSIWGLRLAGHLLHRVLGEPEDGRYANLRKRWGQDQRKWFAFFQFQAALAVLFALPFVAVARNPAAGITPGMVGGVGFWLLSIVGEAIADLQLSRFRTNAKNKGKTCRDGLWRYSRHPNYFFEWLHWFAYVCLAIGSPIWWLAWAGPLVMFVFLRWVSGIPYTEENALRTRGDDYREYQRVTPMLFPWFPKKSTGATSKKTAKSSVKTPAKKPTDTAQRHKKKSGKVSNNSSKAPTRKSP
jgi:steroid 5-alpha reductase family enzyme